MRAIDLSSLLLAPMLSGVLMTFSGPLTAVLVLSAYTVAAWAPELLILRLAFKTSHRLRCVCVSSLALYKLLAVPV